MRPCGFAHQMVTVVIRELIATTIVTPVAVPLLFSPMEGLRDRVSRGKPPISKGEGELARIS